MNKLRLLSFGFFLVVLTVFSSTVEAQDRALMSKAERITNDKFTFFSETPGGARVYAVNKPNDKVLNAVDNGLKNLFDVARKNGYKRNLNYSSYTIFIARPDRTKDSSGQYSPGIAINAAQYAGSVYDKGGYIYAAGMVLGYNPAAFVIAEHTGNLQGISDIVRFEGEHIVLYHNNRRLYNQTADHSQGGGHPILQ